MPDNKKQSSFKTSEDRPAGRKFNPFLAPTEREDEAKLIEDEDEDAKRIPKETDDELDQDAEQEEVIMNPGAEELAEEEEEELELDQSSTQEPQKSDPQPVAKQRSWTYPALGLLIALLVIDQLTIALGNHFFWTPRSLYLTSHVFRTAVLLAANFIWHRRIFADRVQTMYIVCVSVGGVAGILLAAARFIAEPSFWTFINSIIEPVDSALLALFAAYVVYHLTVKYQSLKKQTV